MTDAPQTLTGAARTVLLTGDAAAKAGAARDLKARWEADALRQIGSILMPDRPGRPARPELKLPREMPKRRKGGARASRIALLHAIAHIELNAIDLSVDIAGRFGPEAGPDFIGDWLGVADDEARHFLMLQTRLGEFQADYGDLPAHDGLWEAAEATRHDICARLAVAHTVLEARGLDVTPTMIERLQRQGDAASAEILTTIYNEEIGHVALGVRWFGHFARLRGRDPEAHWRSVVASNFRGRLKRPFNHEARETAGLTPQMYEPLAD